MIQEQQIKGSNNIEDEFDFKELQYYQYLRSIIQTNEISYWIGNPSVSIINGSISLQPLIVPSDHYPNYAQYIQSIKFNNKESPIRLKNQYLVLCGIPNNKTPVEIIENHLIKTYRSTIIQMRVIKTIKLKYYGILMRFKNKETSTKFYNQLFGLEYNQIEMEKIILREMIDITLFFSEISKDGESNEYKIMRKLSEEGGNLEKMTPEIVFLSSHHIKNKSIQLHTQENTTQKLTCTICLEQVNLEIISILCGHYFHSSCLERWQSNTCPLCRYHQQPPVISFCQKCNQCQGLWVCLICGIRLCCGSSNDILAQDSHIYQHFIDYNHSLSMELETKFIFDAKIPAFLHQMFYRDLIIKGAGRINKIEEVCMQKQDMKKNKLSDKISMYQSQVSQEMQKQRIYFEQNLFKKSKVRRQEIYKLKQKYKSLQTQLSIISQQFTVIQRQNTQLEIAIDKAQKQQKIISNLTKMLQQKVNKSKQCDQKVTRLQHQRLGELQQLIKQKRNELLNYNNNLRLQQKLKEKLKGQNIDKQMFLMMQKKKNKKK